jgi:pteridine reductase
MQNNQGLSPQVALITGAARRIGAEVARTLHAEGVNVILHCHTSCNEGEGLCASLNKIRPASAVTVRADLCDTLSLNEMITEALSVWGHLNILVNNASRFYRTEMGKVTEFAWDDLMNSNLKAPFFLSQAAAPYLAEQNGCIINIADIHGDRPMRDYSIYCVSKAGLIMLTKSLAKELGPHVRVNAVSPGPMVGPEGQNNLSDDLKEKLIARTALKAVGHPNEIAKAVLYFARDALYLTGQVLAVDGGRSLMM